jgi:hypothetical protein
MDRRPGRRRIAVLDHVEFTRLKEVAPDLQFMERFTWVSGRSELALDFWWDEWLEDYQIVSIAPCPCRE